MTNHSKLAIQEVTNALLDLPSQLPESGFACRMTVPADCLSVDVTGVGHIRLPVTPNRAKTLIKVARQAPFGRREKTLTDLAVRNAWEIAKSRIRIDKRQWNHVLNPALKRIGQQLGLQEGELKADLYKMLVYEPGQFFAPHRDSEKEDDMLATLVVVLPSAHRGGALVVEHQDTRKQFFSHRTASNKLALIAFYADCQHELKPVTEGYRIALTYNLSYKALAGKTRKKKVSKVVPNSGNTQIQSALDSYMSEPSNVQPLVVLLDHQYSKKSLRWSSLKNMDRVRAQALESALDTQHSRAGYHLNLALVTLSETWYATDDRFDPYERGRGSYGYRGDWEDDEWDDDDLDEEEAEQDSKDHAQLTLHDLIEQYAKLEHWRDRTGKPLGFAPLTMNSAPLVACTQLDKLKPASTYFEDDTGNAGNTLDRTYHRAAIVIWSQQSHSHVLADISLHQLFKYWQDTLKGKSPAEYQTALSSIDLEDRLWRYASDEGTFATLLELPSNCDDQELCVKILKPFEIAALTPARLPKFTQLANRYGEAFYATVFNHWTSNEWKKRGWFGWVKNLKRFIKNSHVHPHPALNKTSILLFDRFSEECNRVIGKKQSLKFDECDDDGQKGAVSGATLVATLQAALLLGDTKRLANLQNTILKNSDNCDSRDLVFLLEKCGPQRITIKSFYNKLRNMLEKRLLTEADSHKRATDDWRISHQINCNCALCGQLKLFLSSAQRQTLDIPAVKAKRLHIHRAIDAQRLPVSHTTTRTGSPYTLNLVKKKAHFTLENKRRQSKLKLLDRVRSGSIDRSVNDQKITSPSHF